MAVYGYSMFSSELWQLLEVLKNMIRFTQDDRDVLREAAKVMRGEPSAGISGSWLSGRLDGLAGRVPIEDDPLAEEDEQQ